MKLKFDADLGYQIQAVASVVDLFKGQESFVSTCSVGGVGNSSGVLLTEDSIANNLVISKAKLLENLRDVQLSNCIAPSDEEKLNAPYDFTVEMETGTGKTYVYLRTIFELNKRYGFSKFIIVVPSIAIKEGVWKSITIMSDHFRSLYDNVAFDPFVYDSAKLTKIRNFATSNALQVMIINIDAFRKTFDGDTSKETKANLIHRDNDKMNGRKPIEFIQNTNPIVIIDEPQSVDNTAKSKEAIGKLNPLFKLRYSATHLEKYNMVYKLDSIDAYEQKLVKQIEVAGIHVQDGNNSPYVRLISTSNKNGKFTAKLELDAIAKDGAVKRKSFNVKVGTDLGDIAERDIYNNLYLTEINCSDGEDFVKLSNGEEIMGGTAVGEANKDFYQRVQIRKTIEEHLEKEKRLRPRGIKVLSLFFIDKVANYRAYDDDGNPIQGKFAQIFEEEYKKAAKLPRFNTLFKEVDLETDAAKVHDGYFSIDGKRKDSKGRDIIKDTSARKEDESAFNTIMKDKEWLLSLDCKLKFIFSHSALREGWDNPNVFQICTLNETASTLKKRQEIGRGLRIAVNQNGERVFDENVNILTVMANESYADFAKKLQTEIEEEEGIKFGVVEKSYFAAISVKNDGGKLVHLGLDNSEKIFNHLVEKGYVDNKGKVQEALKKDLKNECVEVPIEFREQKPQIVAMLRKVAGRLNVKDASERRNIQINKQVFLDPDFKALWDKIKQKTIYSVEFDSDRLIELASEEIQKSLRIKDTQFVYSKAELDITRGEVGIKSERTSIEFNDGNKLALPDIITFLQTETNLTRKTIVEILIRSKRIMDFKKNPQQFIEEVLKIIKLKMKAMIVDGVKYRKISSYYAQELFQNDELASYLDKMLEAKKSIYNYVAFDSQIESKFAEDMEKNDNVKLYVKLPDWFKINTPIGAYNPDWAILVENEDRQQKLFFVVETKGVLFDEMLAPDQRLRIQCGKRHFKALESGVDYEMTNSFSEFVTSFNK
jgi:type III restriction enzyme, res subunit